MSYDRHSGGDVLLASILRQAVDPTCGLILALSESTQHPGEPDVFIVIAQFQDPRAVCPAPSMPAEQLAGAEELARFEKRRRFAAGAGVTREAAVWSALGESVERYAASVCFPEDLIQASYHDVAGRALDPRELILFSDKQYADPAFPVERFDPGRKRAWVQGFDLMSRRDILVPASIAYLGYWDLPVRSCLDFTSSTGIAAGRDYATAAAGAIREVIERDAFMCHWYTRTAPRRLRLSDLSEKAPESLAALCRRPDLLVDVFDMTTDLGIPSVLAMIRPKFARGVFVGASCQMEPIAAVNKALLETCHGLDWIMDAERRGEGEVEAKDIHSFEDHTRYYLNPGRLGHLDFLFRGVEVPLSSCASAWSHGQTAELGTLLEALRIARYRAIVVDLTTDDVRQLGFVVVRAIIPGLHPLSCGASFQHLDDRRLRRFCASQGRDLPDELNHDPHPFP